jgi:hypothetical protein
MLHVHARHFGFWSQARSQAQIRAKVDLELGCTSAGYDRRNMHDDILRLLCLFSVLLPIIDQVASLALVYTSGQHQSVASSCTHSLWSPSLAVHAQVPHASSSVIRKPAPPSGLKSQCCLQVAGGRIERNEFGTRKNPTMTLKPLQPPDHNLKESHVRLALRSHTEKTATPTAPVQIQATMTIQRKRNHSKD